MQGVQAQEQQVGEREQSYYCLAKGFFEHCIGQMLDYVGDQRVAQSRDKAVLVVKRGEHPEDNRIV